MTAPFPPTSGANSRGIHHVQSVLKYSQTLELEYNVPFLDSQMSDIIHDVDCGAFMQSASM